VLSSWNINIMSIKHKMTCAIKLQHKWHIIKQGWQAMTIKAFRCFRPFLIVNASGKSGLSRLNYRFNLYTYFNLIRFIVISNSIKV
jgi:hypothetical protein